MRDEDYFVTSLHISGGGAVVFTVFAGFYSEAGSAVVQREARYGSVQSGRGAATPPARLRRLLTRISTPQYSEISRESSLLSAPI